MADFDQLIKEKAEKAEYPYKHSAWKRFAKRAGIKTGLPAWTIAVVSALVVSITAGVIVIHNTKSHNQIQETTSTKQPAPNPQHPTPNTPTPNSQLPTSNSQLPTANSQPPTPNPQQPTASDRVQNSESKVQGSRFKVQSSTPNSQQPTSNSQQPTANPQSPTPNSQRPKLGPPIEIKVDTITQMEPTEEQLRQGNSRIF